MKSVLVRLERLDSIINTDEAALRRFCAIDNGYVHLICGKYAANSPKLIFLLSGALDLFTMDEIRIEVMRSRGAGGQVRSSCSRFSMLVVLN